MMNKTKHCYYWEGINALGEKVHGLMDTTSTAFVKVELHKQGISSRKITKKQSLFLNRKKIRPIELASFCRQTAILLKAGIPLIRSFDIVAKSQIRLTMKYLIQDIKMQVENGLSFSEALNHYPNIFNELTCNLISVGEKTGNLEPMLETLANYKEKLETIKRKLKKALIYPATVLFIACLVSFILLFVVVPQFESLFESFGADLPPLTRAVIQISTLSRAIGLPIFLGAISLGYSFFKLRKYVPELNLFFDRLSLKCPIFGVILTKAIIARFSQTLAVSFAAGLPLFNALDAAEGVIANWIYAKAISQIKEKVYSGQQMNQAMENTLLFPNLVIQMIAIGEEAGSLEPMLRKIADFYEEDISNAVDRLNHLLEPVIMTILGLIVGILVTAMYLPIFKLGAVM
ncbi:type II secretion system F family protein [Legionella micdadei]|uniref:Type 4 fimbrial assembly protein pilC n=2 Tax=Legionella micdadei TaxID=451 RepID=A0A098GEC2_LEGMI|nr:Type 4 fimbrial assembly protein pilC [Legionella micdadei]